MFRKKGILVLTMAMILASVSLTACQKTQETASVSSETSVLSAVSEGQETSVSSAEEDDRINRKSFAEEGFGRYGSVAQ